MAGAAPRVVRADAGHLDALAELADAFRGAYRAEPAPDAVRAFLADGLGPDAPPLLLAELDGAAAGFAAIDPVASLLRLDKLWTVTALYVTPEARRRGVAVALLGAARDLAAAEGVAALQLAAGWDNAAARGLLERLGYERDLLTTTYELKL